MTREPCKAAASPALSALLALLVANFVLQPLTEPDFGWHLRAGLDLIRQQGRVPLLDPYSHTMPDWPWVEHAWLTDLLIGLLHTFGGGLAVIVFFGVVTAAAWIIASLASEANASIRLSACALSLWVALPFLGARTQMITLLGLALLMWLLHRLEEGETSMVWWIPPLFLLWANLHGGFTAGIFYLSLVLVLSWLITWFPSEKLRGGDRLGGPTLRKLVVATGIGAALTLVNPYGWGLHKEIWDSLSDRFMIETLREWHPVSLDSLAGRMFAAYVAGLGLAMACWYRRLEPVRWGMLAVFLLLALRHLRNIPLFLIVTLPLTAQLAQEGLRRLSAHPFAQTLSPPQWAGGLTLGLGLFLLYLGPEHLQRVWRFGLEPAGAFRETSYPIEAVEWIATHRHRLGGRPVHDYQYGGFLLWWLPEEKIFIDGRMPAWRIGDRWILKDYVDLYEADVPRVGVLDKYAVDWALLKRDSVLARTLAGAPAWRKEYEDAKVVIYGRETSPAREAVTYSKTGKVEASGERLRAASGSE